MASADGGSSFASDRKLTLDRLCDTVLCVCLLSVGSVTPCLALQEHPHAAAADSTKQPARSIEDLNLKGAGAENPPFTDTVLGADSVFRRSLFNHGLLLRMTASGGYIQNMLEVPVAAIAQAYTGQREFGEYSLNPVLTADLHQLGLHKAQLTINGQLQQATWGPAQPTAFSIDSVYFYKEFGEDRVEMKIGYLTTDFQFIGLQVGGQVTSGAQGVYAVLPYEVGISYTPVEAPAVTLKYRWDSGLYLKGAVQRAGEPGSEEAALHRDAIGLRFLPRGDKLLLVGEAGLKRPSAGGKLSQWYRAGIIANNTPYPNLATGQMQSGNYCAYLLADHQLWQPQASNPGSTPAAPRCSSPPASTPIASTTRPASTTPRRSAAVATTSPPSSPRILPSARTTCTLSPPRASRTGARPTPSRAVILLIWRAAPTSASVSAMSTAPASRQRPPPH